MPVVDISMTGDLELTKKLHKLPDRLQKKIVKAAFRKEARKIRQRIVDNIDRLDLIDTGDMRQAFRGAKVKSATKSRRLIRIGTEFPTREELGIAPNDKNFYPAAVEYGHPGAAPKPFIRPAIDDHKDKSLRDIGNDIGAGIVKEALK